ncbi:MAG: type II toxin-antitoxin system PemK/MazF family toxin [Nitrospinae bacterium]|nr:type II toxin-antitoxin system PemK/MazF family toxin [Nitrospinota bacterium]MBI3814549.1 type II toxin-antitoxin system PemK/MazF family toxin [Nitrospinota bacterium]
MTKGDIVLVKFPFTDLSGSKLRPALVLISGRSDVAVAFVTTNFKDIGENDLMLRPNSINGLKKDSLLKLNKIATLDLDLVMGKIGNLDESELRKVDKKLIDVFKIKVL